MSGDLGLRCVVLFHPWVVVEGGVICVEVFWAKFRGAGHVREDAGIQGLVQDTGGGACDAPFGCLGFRVLGGSSSGPE